MKRLHKLALGLAWLALLAGILLVLSRPEASQAQAPEPDLTATPGLPAPGSALAVPRLFLPQLSFYGGVNNPITPVPTTPAPGTVLPPVTPTASLTPTPAATNTPVPPPTATPTATPPPGCPQGMFSCWHFEENGGSSSFVNSAAPLPAACSGAGCPVSVAAKIGNGLSFDGVIDGLSVAANPLYDWAGDSSFSVELWVRTGQACTGNKVFVGRGDEGASWWLGCSEAGNVAAFYLRDSTGVVQSLHGDQAINDDKWRLLAAVRDGATGETSLYVNGELAASASASFPGSFASADDLTIGFLGGGYYFNGRLDEVAIYSRPLPTGDIRAHYFLAHAYCQVCAATVRIMPVGDSITRGFKSPSSNGYRRRLFRTLDSSGYNVNFVGSLQDGASDFDRDHEGHGGWHADDGTVNDVQSKIYTWLSTNPADVVLLHIGTNDISAGGQNPAEVGRILDEVWRYDPDITVVLAQIINRKTHSTATTQYNDGVRALAEDRIAQGDKVILVDMEAALSYTADMADNLHPNDSGYNKMADVWLAALESFLPVCP